MRKTGYSWVSVNTHTDDLGGGSRSIRPIRSKKDRKLEVRRLENALGRLLLNLGSDVDPNRYRNDE